MKRIPLMTQSTYYQQVAATFHKGVPCIVAALAKVKQTADLLAQQHDYFSAAMIYETLVMQTFEESHLYSNEEEDGYYDAYDDVKLYYPEEKGLEEFIGECIEALGSYLANKRADEDAREKSIAVLFDIYKWDVFKSHGFAAKAAVQLARYATPLERVAIAEGVRDSLAEAEGSLRQTYAQFLLDLQKNMLEDEAYLQIAHEHQLTSHLINRLLTIGCVDEAAKEMQLVGDMTFLELADLFIQHKQYEVFEKLAQARVKEKPDTRLLMWLRNYDWHRGNQSAELEVAEILFYRLPTLKRYQDLCDLATPLDCWQAIRPTVLATLAETNQIMLLIEIALDEGHVDHALHLLKSIEQKDNYGTTYEGSYYGPYSQNRIELQVAQAAEETHPHASLAIYQNRIERIIALRERKSYKEAAQHLARVRSLYEKLGEDEAWRYYMTKMRVLTNRMHAMKEEMRKAKL